MADPAQVDRGFARVPAFIAAIRGWPGALQ